MRPADIAGFLLYGLAAALGRLPMRVLGWFGNAAARLALLLDVREAKVARRNLEIVYPDVDQAERDRLLRQVLRGTCLGLFETLRFWTRPETDNLRWVGAVQGQDLFD